MHWPNIGSKSFFLRAWTELRTEVSCFRPPQQGELYLSCKTFGVISIVRSAVGSRRTAANVTSLHDQCRVSPGRKKCKLKSLQGLFFEDNVTGWDERIKGSQGALQGPDFLPATMHYKYTVEHQGQNTGEPGITITKALVGQVEGLVGKYRITLYG